MAEKEDYDWMELLEAAVDSPESSAISIQFSRSASPEGASTEITENDLNSDSSALRPLDSDSELGIWPYPVTCHLCDSHNTLAIPADTLHYAICEHLLERNRKRKAGALDSPVATPDKSSPISQPFTSCLEDGHEEEGEATASPMSPRKKPRLLSGEETIALLSAELKELKASLLRAQRLAHKYQKYESLYLKQKDQQPVQLIPRPEGERGKNGWSLRKALQLEGKPDLYLSMLASVRQAITSAGLDWEKTFHKQSSARVTECFRIIKENNPHLERFEDNWPARELVISCMQNKRKTRNRKPNPKAVNEPEQMKGRVTEGDDENGNSGE